MCICGSGLHSVREESIVGCNVNHLLWVTHIQVGLGLLCIPILQLHSWTFWTTHNSHVIHKYVKVSVDLFV